MKGNYQDNTFSASPLSKRDEANLELKKDLVKYVENFRFQKEAWDNLTAETGINSRTLRRYYAGESRPTPHNMMKLYKVFLGHCRSLKDFSEALPKCVYDVINKHPQFEFLSFSGQKIKGIFHERMENDALFRKIYLRANQSNKKNPLMRDWIRFKMGEMGEQTLNEMIKLGLLKESSEGISVNADNSPDWEGELVHKMASLYAKEHFRPEAMSEDGECGVGFLTSGVSEEAYREIMIKMQNFYNEVREIANKEENKGDVKMWTSLFLDKVS